MSVPTAAEPDRGVHPEAHGERVRGVRLQCAPDEAGDTADAWDDAVTPRADGGPVLSDTSYTASASAPLGTLSYAAAGAAMMGPYRMPRRAAVPKVETPATVEAINTIYDAYADGGFVCVSGIAGSGKTTMTEILEERTRGWYDPTDPETCDILRYEVGKADPRDQIAMKRICVSLLRQLGGGVDEGFIRRASDTDVAFLVIQELKLRGIGLVVLDEAGGLTVDAVRGLMLVLNTARQHGHQLLIVLVGMDNLPKTLKKLPQISRRVVAWVFFKPYNEKDTYDFLTKVHPHFRSLDRADPAQWAQVAFIHRISAGLPGQIVPFLNKVDRSRVALDYEQIDEALLKSVYEIRLQDENAAINASGFGAVETHRAQRGEATTGRRRRRRGGA